LHTKSCRVTFPPSVPGSMGEKPEATKSRQVHQAMKASLPPTQASDQMPAISQTAVLPPKSETTAML